MKLSPFPLPGLTAWLVAGVLALSPGSSSAAEKGAATVPAGTNAAPQELAVPLAIFDVTSSPVKDPFFPLSTRQAVAAAATNGPAISASSFTLKGLSGSTNQRLALINNRTLAVGEFAEVNTSAGKVKIQCLEIRETSVLIRTELQTEPLELRFEDRTHR
ncbi:MAG: hypothetical protein JWR69_2763 [Pedosphaera sp.]|nr:hypothetical protein [Pedosphaera sp.]